VRALDGDVAAVFPPRREPIAVGGGGQRPAGGQSRSWSERRASGVGTLERAAEAQPDLATGASALLALGHRRTVSADIPTPSVVLPPRNIVGQRI
jgi:hypothetical protein